MFFLPCKGEKFDQDTSLSWWNLGLLRMVAERLDLWTRHCCTLKNLPLLCKNAESIYCLIEGLNFLNHIISASLFDFNEEFFLITMFIKKLHSWRSLRYSRGIWFIMWRWKWKSCSFIKGPLLPLILPSWRIMRTTSSSMKSLQTLSWILRLAF